MSYCRLQQLRLPILFVALAVLVSLGAAAAPPHLRLERSEPEADAVVSEAPTEIRLLFSETPELAVSRISLEGPDGAVKLGGLEEGSDNALWARIEVPLADGTYTVDWRTSSGDGHPIRGTFGFEVDRLSARRPAGADD